MFVIDDLLAVPAQAVAFILKKILTVKHFSSVRSAGPKEWASSSAIREERERHSHHRSTDAATAPPRPRSHDDSDHQAT